MLPYMRAETLGCRAILTWMSTPPAVTPLDPGRHLVAKLGSYPA